MGLSRCARGALVIASKACYGPIPLRFAYLWLRGRSLIFTQKGPLQTIALRLLGLRGIGPARAEEALGRLGLSRCARGALVIASKACYGPIPLRFAYWGGEQKWRSRLGGQDRRA